MALTVDVVRFDDNSLGVHAARTDDGQVLSVLFDQLGVQSDAADTDAAPQVRRAEGEVRCSGSGWVAVQLRGFAAVAGSHGFAHVTAWANGRRLRAAAQPGADPFAVAVAAPVAADGQLRLSLLLLAQRDLVDAGSAAGCWIDSIDLAVLPDPPAPAARRPEPT